MTFPKHPHKPVYPFEGINFTVQEINELLSSIQNKVSRGEVKDGLSAYEVAVKNGYQGTEGQWLSSLRGKTGEALTYSDLTPEQIKELQLPAVLASESLKAEQDAALTKINENSESLKAESQKIFQASSQAVIEAKEEAKKKWLPYIDLDGNISWRQSSSITPPATTNIQGPPGKDGIITTDENLIIVKDLNGDGNEDGKSYALGANVGPEIKRNIDNVKDIQKNTSSYCVSRFHQHTGYWEVIDYNAEAELYSSSKTYNENSIVNLANYTAHSFRATKDLTGIEPDYEGISSYYTLDEAVYFVPQSYRVSGMEIEFLEAASKPVKYKFNGGTFTDKSNWKDDLYNKLIELGSNVNNFCFTDNTIANNYIQELYIKLKDTQYVKAKLNIYNNYQTSGNSLIRVIGIKDNGTEIILEQLPKSTYYNEEENIFYADKETFTLYAIIFWDRIEDNSFLSNVNLKDNAYNINSCNRIQLKERLQLDKCNNTADIDKPVSTPQKKYVTSLINSSIYHSNNNELNAALKEIYLINEGYERYEIKVFNGLNEQYLIDIQAFKGEEKTWLGYSYKENINTDGILELNGHGYAIIDFDKLTTNYIGTTQLINYELANNPIIYGMLLRRNTDDYTITYIDCYSDNSFGVSANNVDKFVGIKSISSAIDTYKSKSNNYNRYVIRAHGMFIAKSTEQFTQTDNGEYAIFSLQSTDYISVQGDGMNATLVSAELPDDLGIDFNYNMYSAIIQNGNNSYITDMTITGINCRYTIHTDRSGMSSSNYYEQHIERCRLISKANTGDAYTVWKSYVPHGIGISNGMKMYMEDCEIITDSSVLYLHSNTNFTTPFLYKCKNIKCIQKTDKTLKFAHVAAISARIKGCFVLENVDGIGRLDYSETAKSPYPTDLADIVIKGYNNGYIGVVKTNIPKYQLRLSVNDISTSHSIMYDTTKSAYNAIIKGDNIIGGNTDIIYSDGQAYKKGGVGFSAWCMGLLPVYNSLGEKLGDCTSANKRIGVIVDDTEQYIVLDKDYTSMSDDDIIADFNTRLSALDIPCTADLYSISAETYMELDSVITLKNLSGKDLTKGLCVKRGTYGFDLALNDDECIGILLDDVVENGIGRILTKGYISKYGGRYLVQTVGGTLTANSRYGVNSDSKLELNDNGKFLAVNSDAVVFDL